MCKCNTYKDSITLSNDEFTFRNIPIKGPDGKIIFVGGATHYCGRSIIGEEIKDFDTKRRT